MNTIKDIKAILDLVGCQDRLEWVQVDYAILKGLELGLISGVECCQMRTWAVAMDRKSKLYLLQN